MADFTTIVSGLPRSGTSMMMQMLAAGGLSPLTDGVRAADGDNPNGYFEFERVKALPTDTAWLDDARGKVVKVIHRLVTQLPEDRPYRVVFMERDLNEVLLSQAKMLARLGKPGGGLAAERLKVVFQQDLERVHTALSAKRDLQVLRVRHADLITDPMAKAKAINAFLGGGLDEERMSAVVDRSLHRSKV
ncbi:MAG: sulfotransferase [Flavobacteriales bacterium]